nr:MAG TPA_asm: hypothetical protein [Caudoviricetes sp.]
MISAERYVSSSAPFVGRTDTSHGQSFVRRLFTMVRTDYSSYCERSVSV